MPTALYHEEVCFFLQEGKLEIASAVQTAPTPLSPDLTTTRGSMIPMLSVRGDNFRFAVAGETCATQTTLIGLVESQRQVAGSRELAAESV
jgi:hypothetical protein